MSDEEIEQLVSDLLRDANKVSVRAVKCIQELKERRDELQALIDGIALGRI